MQAPVSVSKKIPAVSHAVSASICAFGGLAKRAGRKYVSGSSLTTAEELMALSASAGEMAKNYGPGPAEMVLKKPELPENVKGILVEHAG